MTSTSPTQSIGLLGARSGSIVKPQAPDEQRWSTIAMVTAVGLLLAIYWNSFTYIKDFWLEDTYSHGWIIPFIALFIMWTQRRPLGGPIDRDQENKNMLTIGVPLALSVGLHVSGFHGAGWLAYGAGVLVALYIVFSNHEFESFGSLDRWIGAAILIASLMIRLYGTYRDSLPFDRFSFVTSLFGVFLMVGGWPLIRRMWASVLFFVFMLPLPSFAEQKLLYSLQKFAAMASTTVLQVLGVIAHRTGSRIHVDGLEQTLEVAEACSGMRMVTIFGAMVIAMVLIIERPWWEKLILLLSALPIAIATNVIRITATALLFLAVEGTSWQAPLHDKIHDYTGYAMIFIAGGIMWLEYKVLSWLFVEESGESLQSISVPGGIPSAR